MRIIIAGAGEMGFHLAKLLASEGHDIIAIDKNAERLEYASNHLDVATLKGSSLSYSLLEEANIKKSDMLIAVTSVEETNIATSIIAKRLGAKRTIARISNAEFLQQKDKFNLNSVGIDEVIIPESLAAREIKRLLRKSTITDTFEFDKGALTLVGITLDQESPLINKSLIEISQAYKDNFTNVAILRNNKTLIPSGKSKFYINDHVYFIAPPDGVDLLTKLSGKKPTEIRNITILGGSRVGINTAKELQEMYHVKIIEKDKEKCYELADMFPDVMIINGDGRDVDLLVEEGIQKMGAFVAVTGDSETNIISSLMAKNKGMLRTIALVENMDYIHLSQSIGIDTLINKKLISANFIFRYIRKGEIVSITGIHGVEAEVLEFEVGAESKILETELQHLTFPKTAVVGGVIRKGVGHAVRGDFLFMPTDRVVVLCTAEAIGEVERFFA